MTGENGDNGETEKVTLFRVDRDEGRTRIEDTGDVLGWGAQFPSGLCYVDWNRDAYPPEDRLERPHVSMYGSLEDVRQGTGGRISVIRRVEVLK